MRAKSVWGKVVVGRKSLFCSLLLSLFAGSLQQRFVVYLCLAHSYDPSMYVQYCIYKAGCRTLLCADLLLSKRDTWCLLGAQEEGVTPRDEQSPGSFVPA